ncbi:hypothetical protein PRZ48_005856 [Zasmidium cellare]|uniref:Terpene synthase n=1 Tax=Zasmidium cellare TaxID=395010 RepID=A0ABR0EMP5_ZASCE|nr:hypothetical protein PRZ48_005856 [Zasmidium cellare]
MTIGPFVPRFGDENIAESFISISSLCGQLDKWMAADSGKAQEHTYSGFSEAFTDIDTDHQTRMSLERVILAFAARWLPLASPSTPSDTASTQETIVRLWREARADMLNVINRPTYRSMLTLYLFGLTPIPEGISDEEELSGMSGSLCVQASLQQVYMLRVRQRSLQFSGSKVSPVTEKTFSLSPDPVATNNFMNAESIAHWAALIFDTSASLTLSCRPILSSGLFGFESDWCWCLVRSCTELFQGTISGWTGEMTESKANQVIAAGSMTKLRTWKLEAVFREALRDGHDESAVNKVYNEIIDGIEQFNQVYGDLLEACQKRIHFLSQATKLRWHELILHYNIGILLIVDAIEATERYDLLPRMSAARTEAEISVLNVLKFGIENTYTITLRTGTSPGNVSLDDARTIVPILAIDPYPHHVVAAVQLMRKAVDRDLATDRINEDTHCNLNGILRRALDLLPGSSKSVVSARRQVGLDLEDT